MKTLCVHKFTMGDVEDIELYIADPLYKFEISDKGRWVMENALEQPMWHKMLSSNSFMYTIAITAKFTDEMATYFQLKWA